MFPYVKNETNNPSVQVENRRARKGLSESLFFLNVPLYLGLLLHFGRACCAQMASPHKQPKVIQSPLPVQDYATTFCCVAIPGR